MVKGFRIANLQGFRGEMRFTIANLPCLGGNKNLGELQSLLIYKVFKWFFLLHTISFIFGNGDYYGYGWG